MRHSHRVVALASLLAFSLLSCGREVTGPDDGSLHGRSALLALAPELPGAMSVVDGSGSVVPFTRVRIVLLRTDGSLLVDRLVDFPPTADSIVLSLLVPLPSSAPTEGYPVDVLLRYVNAAGDTVFAGGPIRVTATAAGRDTPPQQVDVPLTWTGPGSTAESVEISPSDGVATSGTTTAFTAIARDAQGEPVAGAPIIFSTADPTRAAIAAPGNGTVTWLPDRGEARIVASLPSGASDTAYFLVELPASQIEQLAGNGQSGIIGTTLSQPLQVVVRDAQGNVVQGARVAWNVVANASVSADTSVSDAEGIAGTSLTLGMTAGPSSVTAVLVAAPTQSVTFTATALGGSASALAIVSGIIDRVVGIEDEAIVVEARDAGGNRDTGFSGDVIGRVIEGPPEILGDSLVIAAVDGVATFGPLVLDRTGTYRFRFEAAGLAPVESPAFEVTPGPAADLELVLGDGQSGIVGTALTSPIRFRVLDALGSPVTGVTVMFAVLGGGGHVSPASAVSDANGLAQTTWTLGLTVGEQRMGAQTPGVPAIEVTANGLPPIANIVWTGSVSSDWSAPLNWSTGAVPTFADSVVIPGGAPNMPVLTDNSLVGRLTVGTGATLGLGNFVLLVNGSLSAPATPSIIQGGESGAIGLTGTGTLGGALPTVAISGGPYALGAATTIDGHLSIGAGTLSVGTLPLTVTGLFGTSGTGALAMTAGSMITVEGDAVFSGASTAGLLTGGRLILRGNFIQAGGAPDAFAPAVAHETVLDGADIQSVTFLNPGTGAGSSHFGLLRVEQPEDTEVTLGSDVFVTGRLETGAGSISRRISGNGQRVVSSGSAIVDLTFDNVRWVLEDGQTAALNTVRFENLAADVTQFRVARASGTVTLSNLTFTTTPTSGLYLEAEDTDPNDGNALLVAVTGVSPAVHGGRIAALGGASIVGWDAFAGFTWTGNADNTWTDPANWAEGAVPTSSDSVRIPAAITNTPMLPVGGVVVRAFVSEYPQALVLLQPLTVQGRLRLPTSGVGLACDGGSVTLAGGAGTVVANGVIEFCPVRIVSGTATLADDLMVEDDLLVEGTGTLDIGGRYVFALNFSTMDGGRLRMTDPAGTLQVDNGVTFGGGSTVGLLTAGTLRGSGNFSQLGDPASFAPSGAHRTELYNLCYPACAGPQQIAFANDVSSGFAHLEFGPGPRMIGQVLRASGGVLLRPNATVTRGDVSGLVVGGAFAMDEAAFISLRDLSVGGALTLPNPQTFDVDRLTLTGTDQPIPDGPAFRTLIIAGSATAVSSSRDGIQVTDSLIVDGGELRIGLPETEGQMAVLGVFRTQREGRLRMQDALGTLRVSGPAEFAGGPTAGLLTDGLLELFGEFVQSENAAAFSASGAHRTVIAGGFSMRVTFANPGSGAAASHFAHLEVGPGLETGIDLRSDAVVEGVLRRDLDAGRRILSERMTLTVGGVDITGNVDQPLRFENTMLVITDATDAMGMEYAQWDLMGPSDTYLTVDRRTGGSYTFDSIFFPANPPPTGFYVRTRGSDFTLTLTRTAPSTPGGRIEELDGSRILWNP